MGVIAVADRESGYNYETTGGSRSYSASGDASLYREKGRKRQLREAYEKLQMHSEECMFQSDELLAPIRELQEVNKALHESVTNYRRLAENSPERNCPLR